MSHTTGSSAPPLDASGVFAWRLLEFLSNKRPSAQEELGNRRLDKARDLAVKNEVLISPRDLAITKDKFILWVVPSQTHRSHVKRTQVLRRSGRGWVPKGAFRNSYKRGNTARLPKTLSGLLRSLLPMAQAATFLTIPLHPRLSLREFKMKG